MNRQEYIEEVKNSIIDNINDYLDIVNDKRGDISQMEQELHDAMWDDDSITGNGSGSYYCNRYDAKEAVIDNIEEIAEEIEAIFGEIPNDKRYDWEWLDVSMRCAILAEAISYALDELYFIKKEFRDTSYIEETWNSRENPIDELMDEFKAKYELKNKYQALSKNERYVITKLI